MGPMRSDLFKAGLSVNAMVVAFFWMSLSFAQESLPSGEANPPASSSASENPKKKRRGANERKRVREKEIEGTEAAGRFETETILRSRYQLEGRPLEVDPD